MPANIESEHAAHRRYIRDLLKRRVSLRSGESERDAVQAGVSRKVDQPASFGVDDLLCVLSLGELLQVERYLRTRVKNQCYL